MLRCPKEGIEFVASDLKQVQEAIKYYDQK